MEAFIREKDTLESQFGYGVHYDPKPRAGWLLNYKMVKNDAARMYADLYFVDEASKNFRISIAYYPSFLVECTDDPAGTEEYFTRKYEGKIQKAEFTHRIDVAEHNHLNKPPKRFLKLYIRSEADFAQIIREIGRTVKDEDEMYLDFCAEGDSNGYRVYEHDIPVDVQAGNSLNIRCGQWYDVSYDGSEYRIDKNARITYPELRIMAFDIETTKPPLKFPNPGSDEIMMISILTESFGELITNRRIVAEDIREFEYEAKEDMKSVFKISNEKTEEALLVRFIEIIQTHQPHIITTYNGGFFDWPFVERRASRYSLSLEQTISFEATHEYYESPFIMHLDCYKWVKRDSYLPMNNQGLKDAARIKLGYFPDEIDPEDMVRFAKEDPQRLASYSVSDAVATYYLYIKYVHPHVFSISSIIPLPTVQILCRGSGTLCEALLFSESIGYNLLVPPKKRLGGLEFYNGHIVENLTYIGGHVESLRAGIFRADFDHNFNISGEAIDLIIENLDHLLADNAGDPAYPSAKSEIVGRLNGCRGVSTQKCSIYHLDVGAMYPNIILTNRLQPIAVVNEDICIHCDFNKEENNCKRRMGWVSRSEYLPPSKNEISMIRNQLMNESFYQWDDERTGVQDGGGARPQMGSSAGAGRRVSYGSLPVARQESILKERVTEYSKKIYKRVKKIETKVEELVVCQREVPFYVETVRKFRDQRDVVKGYYKDALKEHDRNPTDENKKKIVIYNSQQIAYKCVLNSFYGYVMRTGSRWFSLEMAAAVCHVGGEIIRLAKEMVDMIGIPLELDTDGIWCCLPSGFPNTVTIGKTRVSLIGNILNYFVCKKFTNGQYQVGMQADGGAGAQYETTPQNSIAFEVDGPYKAMIIPSSTDENRLLKKRYVVFDENDKIAELKGFELKRRGELNIVKKFQEDLFKHFNDGANLQECYDSLARTCNYWLDIIYTEGASLGDDAVFDLFSESRNMSKSVEGYGDRKSNIMSTARKLSQFLGSDILEDKLKCEFIISRYPENAPTAERCIPVLIFKHREKEMYLRKWLKTGCTDLKRIIDWGYYRKRFESILQRLVVIPAYFQDIKNPVARVEVPRWIKNVHREKLGFKRVGDIEDVSAKRSLYDIFYSAVNKKTAPEDGDLTVGGTRPSGSVFDEPGRAAADGIDVSRLAPIIQQNRKAWVNFYGKKSTLAKVEYCVDGTYRLCYTDGTAETKTFMRSILLETNDSFYFAEYEKTRKFLPDGLDPQEFTIMKTDETERKTERYRRFFSHFSIKNTYNSELDPIFQLICENDAEPVALDYAVVSSLVYQKKSIFCITASETVFISEHRVQNAADGGAAQLGGAFSGCRNDVRQSSLQGYREKHLGSYRIVVFNKRDPNSREIAECFRDCVLVGLDLATSVFLESIGSLLRRQCDLQLRMREKYHQVLDVSSLFKLPILNVDDDVLDLVYYKEMHGADTLCVPSGQFVQNVIRDETYRSGYYPTYSVQIECVGSLLLAIIEYSCFIGDNSLFDGVKQREFVVLREFLKRLLVSSLQNNQGASFLIKKVTLWLKKESRFISSSLRAVLNILQQKYLINLVAKLKELQCKVVMVSKELIIIDTSKKDLEGCNLYHEYLKNKVAGIPGYELLRLRLVRRFEKLGFVDPSTYFYVEDGEILSFSDVEMPLSFFGLYFGDSEISNDQVYGLVTKVGVVQARLLLRLLSYKRDVHGLASNCYKLIKASGFEENKAHQLNLTVFCRNCGIENLIRKKCLKCYAQIDKTRIEDECVAYLRHLWSLQIGGDRYCNACGTGEERKLKDYCRCGGQFVLKDCTDEIEALRLFVGTRKFDDEVNTVLEYFK